TYEIVVLGMTSPLPGGRSTAGLAAPLCVKLPLIGASGDEKSGAAGDTCDAADPAIGSCIAYPGGPVIGEINSADVSGPSRADDAAIAAGPPPFNPTGAAETTAHSSAARSIPLAVIFFPPNR